MQDHIEENLGRPVTLLALARRAGCSPWHASRLFKEMTGHTPFAYLRLRRLSAAARSLGDPSVRIIDVAFDFDFDSHEGFTRAFTRHFGLSPRSYQRQRPPVVMFMPERMRAYYQNPVQGGPAMTTSRPASAIFVQVVERPARKLILKRGVQARHYFEYCDEVGCQVWEQLGSVAEALHEPMGLWLPGSLRPMGTSSYVQGVEVAHDYPGPVPEGFELIELPPCLWMVFQGPPYDDDAFQEAIAELDAQIQSYQPESWGYAWDDEAAPRFQLEPLGYRGYIVGRPVRRLGEAAAR
jgi:AraC-like DNA-binding protein